MNDDRFVGAVLAWAHESIRELPWRRTRDPWSILVSEVMSQQTQVHRIIAKWELFIERFPTAERCASSPLGDVLELWKGLGYPRRARNLHLAAKEIVAAGTFPHTVDGLLKLPGVGPYTARAVLSFAFGDDVAVVDTNVARVLARVVGHRLSAREVQDLADRLVPAGESWLWNQSMMDLGGTVCTARIAHCDSCPVLKECAWRAQEGVSDPARLSAGVSRPQPRFRGSAREARGRVLGAIVDQYVSVSDIATITQRDEAGAREILDSLIADGLCVVDDGIVRLPR